MSTTPKINDGGPAFPWQIEVKAGSFNPFRGRVVPPNECDIEVYEGMTLRDWLAGQESLSDCDLQISAMEQIVRKRSPKFAENPLAYMTWEAEVRAVLRYIRADAMIRARQIQPST